MLQLDTKSKVNLAVLLTWISTLGRTPSTTSAHFICQMKVENPLTLAYSAIANQESLSGLETEMRKLEGLVKEVVDEMNYLSKREERFSSTNCAYFVVHPSSHYILINILVSTNQRVQNFAWFTILSLAGLGVWQIFHLRAFFKRKYLID